METILSVYGGVAGMVIGFFAVDWYRHGTGDASKVGAVALILVLALAWPLFAVWIVCAAAWNLGLEQGQAFARRHHTSRGLFTRAGPRSYRWSGDGDRYWWRFTYANENRPDGRGREERRLFGLYLTSRGDEDEGAFCLLRGHLLGRTLILRLPALFQPVREWHEITTEPTRTQMLREGRKPGYWETWERSYGFLFQMGALHVDYGAQTHDSSTGKSKVFFLPWRSWRHVRFSIYGLAGEHIWSQFDKDRPKGPHLGREGFHWYDQRRAAEGAAPKVAFEFLDYDKERLTATTQIHESEWHLGEGRWRWLSRFTKPRIRRSLSITFSGETGKRKGSWKGGTIGSGIDVLPGELHEAAFARYAKANGMTYPAPPPAMRVEGQPMAGFVPYTSSEAPSEPLPLAIDAPTVQDATTSDAFEDRRKLPPLGGVLIGSFAALILWGIGAGLWFAFAR